MSRNSVHAQKKMQISYRQFVLEHLMQNKMVQLQWGQPGMLVTTLV